MTIDANSDDLILGVAGPFIADARRQHAALQPPGQPLDALVGGERHLARLRQRRRDPPAAANRLAHR